MKHIKIISLVLGLVVLSALAFVGVAGAQSFKTGDTVTVAANETVDSMFFGGGNNINIAGTVNGDVYCAGQNVTISGTVHGDVFCAGQTVIVSGNIDGSVRLTGQTITLNGTVGHNATIGAQSLIIEKNASIGQDLLGGSQTVSIDGKIGRDIVAGSENLTVNCVVGRNIKGDLTTLTVGSTGQINGNVDFTSKNDPTVTSGGQINGKVTRTLPTKQMQAVNYSPVAAAVGWFIYFFTAMLALGLILTAMFPRILDEATSKAVKHPGQTALVGFAAVFMIPVTILVMFVTIIGVPLAVLSLLAWFIVMILTTPFAGYFLGRMLLRTTKNPYLIMLAGIMVLVVSYFIPILGFITLLATYIFGTGIVLMQGKVLFARIGK